MYSLFFYFFSQYLHSFKNICGSYFLSALTIESNNTTEKVCIMFTLYCCFITIKLFMIWIYFSFNVFFIIYGFTIIFFPNKFLILFHISLCFSNIFLSLTKRSTHLLFLWKYLAKAFTCVNFMHYLIFQIYEIYLY